MTTVGGQGPGEGAPSAELRVHGIGGPTAASVLGCKHTVVAWYGSMPTRSTVRRRPGESDPLCYEWSPLTSGSRWFALWPLLLPFTLVNLGGFMGPSNPKAARAHRLVVSFLGLVLTASTTVWMFWGTSMVWEQLPTWIDWIPLERNTRLAVATAVTSAAALAVVVLCATWSASGFDAYRPPTRTERGRSRGWREEHDPQLDDAQFFDNGREHTNRWRLHTFILVATYVGIVGTACVAKESSLPAHFTSRMGWWTVITGGLQIVGLLGLVAIDLPRHGEVSNPERPGWRASGVGSTAVGLALVPGFVLAGVVTKWGVGAVPAGPAAILLDAYGWSLLAAAVAAVAVVAHRLGRPGVAESAGIDDLVLTGAVARWRSRVALVVGDLDRPLGAFTVVFLATALGLGGTRLSADDAATWRLTETLPVAIARTSFWALLAFLLLGVIRSRANPDSLKRVGNIWDVITFWPRPFHPFAVRPYAERAVPELRTYLDTARPDRLIVSAHSQGSVLAFAALLPLVRSGRAETIAGIELVTFGTPLRSLYLRAFPRYVKLSDIDEVRAALGPRHPSEEGPRGWTNVFRFTDHVGRALFASDDVVAEEIAATRADRGSTQPSQAAATLGEVVIRDPSPEGVVEGHNNYWTTSAVRGIVDGEARSRT